MTSSSDVMATIYNHQSIICLLEYVEKIQREAGELSSIFSSPRSPPPSYESDVTEDSCTTATTTDYSSPAPRSQHQHFRTNIKSMPYLALKSKSMLGKGQIYLPKEGFKRALSWAEGVVSERVLETDNQNKKIEQLILNLLFHPQLKSYIRQNIGGKAVADTASGSASNTRSKPLETKKSSSGKPLQKVAPVYVKKVVAEIVTSVDQIEGQGKIELYRNDKPKDEARKTRPPSMTRMQSQSSHSAAQPPQPPTSPKSSRSKSIQVSIDTGGRKIQTRDIGTQYEETSSAFETEYKEKVDKVEINRVLLSGNYLNSNITNFVSNRLEKLGVNEEVWDLFQLVLDDVNTNINDAKK